MRFLLDEVAYPSAQPNCFLAGTYAIEISLLSENAPNQTLFFELVWSGKWQDGEEDMLRELVMTQVKQIKDKSK